MQTSCVGHAGAASVAEGEAVQLGPDAAVPLPETDSAGHGRGPGASRRQGRGRYHARFSHGGPAEGPGPARLHPCGVPANPRCKVAPGPLLRTPARIGSPRCYERRSRRGGVGEPAEVSSDPEKAAGSAPSPAQAGAGDAVGLRTEFAGLRRDGWRDRLERPSSPPRVRTSRFLEHHAGVVCEFPAQSPSQSTF